MICNLSKSKKNNTIRLHTSIDYPSCETKYCISNDIS